MSSTDLNQILELSGEERFDYFLSEVVEERELWILVNADNRFLKIESQDDSVAYLPVWPSADFALAYAQGSSELKPKSLSLPEFFQKWVPGLTRDGIEVGVFPGNDGTLWITEPADLKQDLQDDVFNR